MNRIDLTDKVAVVTGGAQGIGFAIARRLIESGAMVSLWDRDLRALEEARAALGPALGTVAVDIIDLPGLEAAVGATETELGPISILVNSAGISGGNNTSTSMIPPSSAASSISTSTGRSTSVAQSLCPNRRVSPLSRIDLETGLDQLFCHV